MKTSEVFPSRFIKAADIEGKDDVVVTITNVTVEEVGDDQKPVARFKGAEKGLVLNRTNWDRIAYIAGNDDSDAWPGVRIGLYCELVSFGGKTGPAVRVRPPGKQAAAAQQQATAAPRPEPTPAQPRDDMDDEIPW
jgi:hypothetical protein